MVNPSLSFDNFIVTRCTHRAYAAAQAVAEGHPPDSGLLYLFGVPGTGKTHLLHAIVNQVSPRQPVHIYTAERFESELCAAVRHSRLVRFRNELCAGEMFCFDDVDLLRGRTAAQLELLNIIENYREFMRPVVVTGNTRPRKLRGTNAYLGESLAGGVCILMKRSDLASRMVILNIKAKQLGIDLPEDAAREIAVDTFGAGAKVLVQKLVRVSTCASLLSVPIDISLTKAVLAER